MPDGPKGERPAALLRFEFDVDRPVVSARLHATAQGLYEAFLNAERVGDAELTPGYTQYDAHLQVQTVDVTASVRAGAQRPRRPPRRRLVPRADRGHPRGRRSGATGSPCWPSCSSPTTTASVTVVGTGPRLAQLGGPRRRGRPHRRRAVGPQPAAAAAGTSPASTTPPGTTSWSSSTATPAWSTPRRRRCAGSRRSCPRSVTRLAGGAQVVDLGQNINGWVRLTDLGPAGTTITLTHGEWLAPDGDVTVDQPRAGPAVPARTGCPPDRSTPWSRRGVPGDVFEPRRTTHGFQYVRIEGHPGELTVDDVRGVVVHTDMRRTGWFTCSDERVNRLHEAAVWSFRDNACDIPTDCPHRERHGVDRRLAAVRAHRRLPVRRRRLLDQVAARRRRRPVARRHDRERQPEPRATRAARARSPCSTARPAGATPR